MFLKHEFKVWVFSVGGTYFFRAPMGHKDFFWDPKILAAELQGVEEEKLFSFFGHWILWFFLSFMIWRKKAKDLFLIWLIKCPYFFVVIADDKFEMIVGRTFDIFFGPLFHKFFIRKFSIGFICKKDIWIHLLHYLLIVGNKNRYKNLRSWENFIN